MYVLTMGTTDLARVRFAVSPLWETLAAVRALVDPRPRAYHLPWFESVRPLLPSLDLAPLVAVQPRRGWTPDFLTPVPATPVPDVAEQLAQVRRTPLEQVRAELARAAADRGGEPAPAVVGELLRSPARARARCADAIQAAWETLVAPHWPQLRQFLEGDLAHHARLLSERGPGELLPVLDRRVRWTGEAVVVVDPRDDAVQRRDLAGEGLLLMPSAFVWPSLAVLIEVPLQPGLVYPARGIAALWQPVPGAGDAALTRLLGRTRALLLTSVREPSTTTTLARRHAVAPATVSQHLAALRGAGLVVARRDRSQVFYSTTELGGRLLAASGPGTSAET